MPSESMLFRDTGHPLEWLLANIGQGDLALPDIQRPFVWKPTKVRDLFDSMFRGYPVGFLLLWQNDAGGQTRQLGVEEKARREPQWLIIDGQQRLSSLYAVMRGVPVLDKEYRPRQISIAFCPLTGAFEVTDAAIRKDPEWIASITELWASGSNISRLRKDYLNRLAKSREHAGQEVSEAEEELIETQLNRLYALKDYRFTALEIDGSVAEDQVAEIFVRINSQGVALKQADFILTLMSVHWESGRSELETFCAKSITPSAGKSSGFNYIVEPDPGGLLRAAAALAFDRARLRFVYQILRGRDPETLKLSDTRRSAQFQQLAQAQAATLDLTNWQGFLDALGAAGFRTSDLISSELAIWYSYALYLIGRQRFRVSPTILDPLIAQWFMLSQVTSRYTGSSESQAEEDLNALKVAQTDRDFVAILRRLMSDQATTAFWTEDLPKLLTTSGSRNAAFLTYLAGLNAADARVLFSQKRVRDLMDPTRRRRKAAIEKHHLFPKAHLLRLGVTDLKDINQVANLAILEWPRNLAISDQSPKLYVPLLEGESSTSDWEAWQIAHALPPNWQELEYPEFLRQRRALMAAQIRQQFEALLPVPAVVPGA